MRNIIITIMLMLPFIVNGQIINGLNDYAIVPVNSDSSNFYFLETGQTLITNTDDVLGMPAFKADTSNILELVDEYGLSVPKLPDNEVVRRNELYDYNGEYCRIIQTHNRSTVNHYNPHDLPALYLFRNPTSCDEWVQPTGAHDAYNIGDCVTFEGNTYESLIDANVWSPSVYTQGWQLIE